MDLRESKIESVGSIIKEKSLNLEVTFYQRPYRWERQRIEDLFADYKKNKASADLEDPKNQKKKEYLLGAIVLVEKEKEDKACKYEIVDGQQRLTTLYLMNFLRFCLLRCEIEELIKTSITTVDRKLEKMIKCYQRFVGQERVDALETFNNKLAEILEVHDESKGWSEDEKNEILKIYRLAVGLPDEKNLSNEPSYIDACVSANNEFFKNENLRISYVHKAYNTRLKESLSNIILLYSDTYGLQWRDGRGEPDESTEEWPFVERSIDILNELSSMSNLKAATVRRGIQGMIKELDDLIENLCLCEIITGNQKDAYQLFEALNDRAETVSDLELMKDYFYRGYVLTSKDDSNTQYKNLTNLDDLWSTAFAVNKNRTFIAYCATVYLTGTSTLLQNTPLKKEINRYIEEITQADREYSFTEINNDFETFQNVSIIFNELLKNGHKNLACSVENDANASMVKRALAVAHELNYQAIVAAIITDILYHFIKFNLATNNSFETYIEAVFTEATYKETSCPFKCLEKDCHVIWRSTILGKDYKASKEYADQLIKNRYKTIAYNPTSSPVPITIDPPQFNKLESEFKEWILNWRYGSHNSGKLRIKLLFYHLVLRYDYKRIANCEYLCYNETISKTFKADAIKQDLDHIEGRVITGSDPYYKAASDTRLNEINSIGNMMILAERSNKIKQSTPFEKGIEFYKNAGFDNWMYQEISDLFNVSANHDIMPSGFKVPTEDFFEARTQRLIKCFSAVLACSTDSDLPTVTKL